MFNLLNAFFQLPIRYGGQHPVVWETFGYQGNLILVSELHAAREHNVATALLQSYEAERDAQRVPLSGENAQLECLGLTGFTGGSMNNRY